MKKKLKVKKAFSGKMIKAATAQGKKVIKPGFLGLPPRPPGTVPGSGAGIVKPGQINPFGPGGLPIGGYGNQSGITPVRGQILPSKPRDPNMYSTTPPRPGTQQPNSNLQNIFNKFGGMGPPQVQLGVQPIVPRDYGFGSGPMQQPQQPVGDPRRGAAFIPGNPMQEMMRGPQQAAPAQPVPTQQAAPVQPVPAMKKGGVVRGGRAEIKGTRPAKLS
jgi:hypothetical protein